MNDVQSFIDEGRMDQAAAFILSNDVKYNTLREMVQIDEDIAGEDTKTFALILSVKAPKKVAKKLKYMRTGREVETYHRLVLCR